MSAIVPPEGFRHHMRVQVRWGDMDAMGHVNNAVYLTYLEQARVDYTRGALRLWDGKPGQIGLIMARAEIDFKLPLVAGDDVHVFTRTVRLGGRSARTEQWIMRRVGDALELAAQAFITVVIYDYAAGKSTAIPDQWRARIREYEVVAPEE